MGPLSNADEKYFKHSNPYWTEMVENTSFNSYWKPRDLSRHFQSTTPAILAVGGWFDAEDLQGPLRLYRSALAGGPQAPVTLVMGPWVHGGWSRGDGSSLGPVQFAVKTAEYFREKIQFPFFEHFLKGKGEWKPVSAWLFQTGMNEWRTFDAWPPAAAPKKTLYLRAGGKLSFDPPAANEGADEYVSDPARPVPFFSSVTSGVPQTYMVDDQRHAAARPDVLTYQTEPLDQDITLGGPVQTRLFAATSGTDSDWVVKLIDVYPVDAPNQGETKMGGYQQLLRGEPFRGRFWKSFEKAESLPAGQFVQYEYALPDVLHTFRKGHRIMVQIQSSWFPLVDRNPQKFVESIPFAKAADFQKATQRIGHNAAQPSALSLVEIR